MLQTILHYFLHFIFIGFIAYWYDKKNWKRNYLILLATLVMDADHLLADPVFDPMRCGIGYHPLHSYYAIAIYILGVIFVKHNIIKLIFIGLLFHVFTDLIDCIWMFSKCEECFVGSEIYKLVN